MKCFVIDDEQPAINVLSTYIKQTTGLELAGSDTNPLRGLERIKEIKPDVVFLDIQMDEMNGLEVMKLIPSDTKVIFCTAYSQFAVESYNLNAVDYLMKPVPYYRFLKAVYRVEPKPERRPEESKSADDYLFFSLEKGKMGRIDLNDIDYIEAKGNYMAFFINGKPTMVYITLKELEEMLPPERFMRIHKSFIISTTKIELMEKNMVKVRSYTDMIPVGEVYKDELNEKIKGRIIRFS